MQHHTGNYSFTCDICQKGFTKKKPFEDHMRKHEGRCYKCEFCDRSFQVYRSFEKHVRIHTNKYPFLCSTCNAGFNLRLELEAHENEHSGRGVACMRCGKAFYSDKEFQKHQQKCTV